MAIIWYFRNRPGVAGFKGRFSALFYFFLLFFFFCFFMFGERIDIGFASY